MMALHRLNKSLSLAGRFLAPFAMLLAASAAQAADAEAPKPKIEFKELSHDFGKAPQETKLKCNFTFKNTGTGVLIIEDVKAG